MEKLVLPVLFLERKENVILPHTERALAVTPISDIFPKKYTITTSIQNVPSEHKNYIVLWKNSSFPRGDINIDNDPYSFFKEYGFEYGVVVESLVDDIVKPDANSKLPEYFLAKGIAKVSIKNIFIDPSDTKTFYAEYTYLDEGFTDEDENYLDELCIFLDEISKAFGNKWMYRKDFTETKSLAIRTNLVADYLILNDLARYEFLASNSLNTKLKLLIKHSKSYFAKKAYEQNKQLSKQRKTPKRTSHTSSSKKNANKDILDKIQSLPPEVQAEVKSDVEKLQILSPGNVEYAVVNEYLHWVVSIPWNIYTQKEIDIANLLNVLNESHYGLEQTKRHIIEYLALELFTKQPTGMVLCFVGEPGTGKTTLAKEIASASHRRLVKVAMGGVTDESELRGHRRTYVASHPGKIIRGLKQAGAMDPLFLFDEVDKISEGRSNPLYALLEILDPEQNKDFLDNYLAIPVDLSKAMFICTANELDSIPKPLLDRMEILKFQQYSVDEKTHIIKHYLLKKILKDNHLSEQDISILDDAAYLLARNTNIRKAEQVLSKIIRSIILDMILAKEAECSYTITVEDITNALQIVTNYSGSRIGF